MTTGKHKVAGFTLLELMIATILGSILLLTASALFMTFMIGNASTNARRQISAEGTQILGTLEYHVRNAKHATCTLGTSLLLKNLDGTQSWACFNGSKLHLSTGNTCATLDETALNSSTTLSAISLSTRIFNCVTAANGKQTVEIQFRLGTSEGSSVTSPFSTIVQLRNS